MNRCSYEANRGITVSQPTVMRCVLVLEDAKKLIARLPIKGEL